MQAIYQPVGVKGPPAWRKGGGKGNDEEDGKGGKADDNGAKDTDMGGTGTEGGDTQNGGQQGPADSKVEQGEGAGKGSKKEQQEPDSTVEQGEGARKSSKEEPQEKEDHTAHVSTPSHHRDDSPSYSYSGSGSPDLYVGEPEIIAAALHKVNGGLADGTLLDVPRLLGTQEKLASRR